jgi:hypothetical protein
MSARWTEAEMLHLAASGVTKVDLLGQRGTTLVTCEEVAAMAAVIALSGVLPSLSERASAGTYPEFRNAAAPVEAPIEAPVEAPVKG